LTDRNIIDLTDENQLATGNIEEIIQAYIEKHPREQEQEKEKEQVVPFSKLPKQVRANPFEQIRSKRRQTKNVGRRGGRKKRKTRRRGKK
jgi:hypothetical protein